MAALAKRRSRSVPRPSSSRERRCEGLAFSAEAHGRSSALVAPSLVEGRLGVGPIGDALEGGAVQDRPSTRAKVIALPRVGGLHHRYFGGRLKAWRPRSPLYHFQRERGYVTAFEALVTESLPT
jgi:hypothetical protein